MKSGVATSEFWLHLLATVAPAIVVPVINAVAPGEPWAMAVVACITSLASHFGATQYSANRTELKTNEAK